MAIKTQYPYIDDNGEERDNLIKTYSDANMYIKQEETGNIYDAAVDVYPCRYTYTETDIPIEIEEDEEIDYQTAYNNLAQEVIGNE